MGLLKKIFQVKTYLITFAAGALVHRCVSADERYMVMRLEHEAYLMDKETKTKIPINPEPFQVGTLEYRLEGVLVEPKLPDIISYLQGENTGGKKQ